MTSKQLKKFDDTQIEHRLKRFKISKERYLTEKNALQALPNKDGLPAYSVAQIDFLILQRTSENTVKTVLTHHRFFIQNGFDTDSIYCMARQDGGSCNLIAVRDLLKDLKSKHLTLTDLDKDFSLQSIERIISHSGGSLNLKTVINLLTDLKNQQLNLTDLNEDFTFASVEQIVSHNGGSHNLTALIKLLTDLKSKQLTLSDLNKDLNFAAIKRILSVKGSSHSFITVIDCLKSLKAHQLTLTDLDRDLTLSAIEGMISRSNGSKRLKTILAYWLELTGKKCGSIGLTVQQMVKLLTKNHLSVHVNRIIERYHSFGDKLLGPTHLIDPILSLKAKNPSAFQWLMNNHQTLTTQGRSLETIIQTLCSSSDLLILDTLLEKDPVLSTLNGENERSTSGDNNLSLHLDSGYWDESLLALDVACSVQLLDQIPTIEQDLDRLLNQRCWGTQGASGRADLDQDHDIDRLFFDSHEGIEEESRTLISSPAISAESHLKTIEEIPVFIDPTAKRKRKATKGTPSFSDEPKPSKKINYRGQPKTLSDSEIEARLTEYSITSERYLAQKEKLKALRNKDGLPGYSTAQIDYFILQRNSENTVRGVLAHHVFFMENGFNTDSIYRMASHRRGSRNLRFLMELFIELEKHQLTLEDLDKDLTFEAIEKIMSHEGGALNLSALIHCLKILKNNQLTLVDLDENLTFSAIERMLSRTNGSKRLKTILAHWLELTGNESSSAGFTVQQMLTLLTAAHLSTDANKMICRYQSLANQLLGPSNLLEPILLLKAKKPAAFQCLMSNHQTLTTQGYSLETIITMLHSGNSVAILDSLMQQTEPVLCPVNGENDSSRLSEIQCLGQDPTYESERDEDLYLSCLEDHRNEASSLFLGFDDDLIEEMFPSLPNDEPPIEDVTTFFALTPNKKRKASPSELPPSKESAHEMPLMR